MKTNIFISAIVTIFILAISCQKLEIYPESYYECDFEYTEIASLHPKAEIYQKILDDNRKLGIVGASLMIKDKEGI